MRIVNRDSVATGLVDVVVFTYASYLALGNLPVIESVRGVAAVGLVLGLVSRAIARRTAFRQRWSAIAAGFVLLVLGTSAMATQHQSWLALLMASIIGLWIADVYVATG
ncbi:MAG: hypothetical protein QOE00_2544 [Ilumatobacteraceae bacterium]